MKKLLSLVLVVLNIVLLCGCSVKETIASDKQEYIVSALGFDSEGEKIKMTIEAIVINSDDLKEDKENKLFSGVGETVEEAMGDIISQVTQPLSLGHSAVAVMGSELDPTQTEKVFSFLNDNGKINIAIMMIYTKSAFELLSVKPLSSVAVGYDIMSMLEVSEEEKGTAFNNRLYEANSLKFEEMKTYYLPFVGIEDEKPLVKGLGVFKDNRQVRVLENKEIPLFCLARDSFTKGEFTLESKKYKVDYSAVTYDFKLKENLEINLSLRLKAEGNKEILKAETENFLKGYDVCALGNVIRQKEPKIWSKIKDNYEDFYKRADIKVNIYE